jgi:hypothetical protein
MSLQLWDDDNAALQRRLEVLGLPVERPLILHENRTVMVSQARGRGRGRDGVIRLHRGYIYAPDRVLRAIVTFLDPRSRRPLVRKAQRELLAFPVDDFLPLVLSSRRPEPPQPGDVAIFRRLRESHRRMNELHFGGRLPEIPFRISGRMRSRLGELALDERQHRAREIAFSRRHLRRDPWEEIEHTLLHEMVHQWQAEEGLVVDHGATFRRKAREVGVEPAAKRYVSTKKKAARYK